MFSSRSKVCGCNLFAKTEAKHGETIVKLIFRRKNEKGVVTLQDFCVHRGFEVGIGEMFRILIGFFNQLVSLSLCSDVLCFQPRRTCPECVLCWLPVLWPFCPHASSKGSRMLLGIFEYLYELWSGTCFQICFQCCLEGGETTS